MRTKAYSYVRMSTDIQLKGDSLRRQLESSRKYAEDNNLELVENIEGVLLHDIGVSSFRGQNAEEGALAVFLDALEKQRIKKGSVLIVESLDRLSRNRITEALTLFMSILSGGVEIVTLTDNQRFTKESINDSSGISLITSLLVMMRANEESETKSKRLKAVWENKRKEASVKPLTSICPAWLEYDKATGKFKVVDEKARVVRKIFSMCIHEGGTGAIASYLNENKIPVFGRGQLWYRSYVKKILRNRAVVGEFKPGIREKGRQVDLGVAIPNYYPKLIDENEYYLAQAAIEARKECGRGRRGEAYANIFSGVIYCGLCGAKMTLRNRGNKDPHGKTYVCSRMTLKAGCDMPPWSYLQLEPMLLNNLKEVNFNDIDDDIQNLEKELRSEIAALEQESIMLQSKIDQQVSFVGAVDFTPEISDKLKGAITATGAQLEKCRSSLVEKKLQLSSMDGDTVKENQKFLKNIMENGIDDYTVRAKIHTLILRSVDKITLKYDKHALDPWNYDDTSPEVMTYRESAARRNNMRLDDIVDRPSFKRHVADYAREVVIRYKSKKVRYLQYKEGSSFIVSRSRHK